MNNSGLARCPICLYISPMRKEHGQAPDIETVIRLFPRPLKAVVTAGMPYANGPLHLGHLAGAHLPADIYARWMRMLIGAENVLFVSGTDDHGSASELSAVKAGKPIAAMIEEIHGQHSRTLQRYAVSLDVYSGTSRPDCLPVHKKLAQDFITKLYRNGLLEKRISRQWYDTKLKRFLQDRFVRGQCPNPKCDNDGAYSDECDRCGLHYDPAELINPRSTFNDSTPVLKDTAHWWLDMWQVSEVLRAWIEGKAGLWRTQVYNEVINTVLPSLRFDNVHEPAFKEIKAALPKHKSRYAAGKKLVAQFGSKPEMVEAKEILEAHGIVTELVDGWAHRPITRDVEWGIPVPPGLDAEMTGKTLYVWPDSLIAPISFSQLALTADGRGLESMPSFWQDPGARITQFLGQDNVFFYILMQGAMWLGSQDDITRMPAAGDYQLTDVVGSCMLMVAGDKMSKSRGNFFTGEQLLDEKGYSGDQIRYFLAMLGLADSPANFDFHALDERNRFLAGPMNAAFEKPIAACHSKFDGVVPEGALNAKVLAESQKLIPKYLRAMDRAEYTALLLAIENYARLINSMFTQFKPHDDRFPEEQRRSALFSSFFVLKNIMIMLYPFVPVTMDLLRRSLCLPEAVFTVEELGTPIAPGHRIGEKTQYFPIVSHKEGAVEEV